ncbi:hypothetical protein DNTS_025263 [Danionella cerebrum]|uniref:DNA-directed RNA polymerase III subunit RPC5 C-terminal domain-containing protein n=1 Tax=Danionella cerebrum TaxID=2873325 RepID=A0A553Q1I0_9TELE|nr:hypothetical protein DNTS_025263 [Danionella translucida]
MASGDDDDPIIKEIDVYLARSLVEKLYLLQYPVRPASMSYSNTTNLRARIKPKQQKVELEVAMDTMSPNYCRSKGEQIALNVDGLSSEDSNIYSTKMMDKQTFSSIQATTNTSRYAAAVFRRGELHLTPLQGILQMRPSFTYLDRADSKHREREAANEGMGDAEIRGAPTVRSTGGYGTCCQEEVLLERLLSEPVYDLMCFTGDSSQDEAEEDVKQITVRFSRPESEQARQRRIQSYEFLQKKQAEEPWMHLQYHGLTDSRSEHERQYLFCQTMDSAENTELVKTPREYLSMLMPPLAEEKVVKPVGPSNVLSMAQLRTLPLGDQVKTLMKNVKVIPFANLMGLLSSGTDSTSVLRCIQQVALLVQGNWVVKSDVLYPNTTCSSHSGVPAEVLCRGRDFVVRSCFMIVQNVLAVRAMFTKLSVQMCPSRVARKRSGIQLLTLFPLSQMWRFTLERTLMRKEVAAVVKLPPEDVKDFLEQMASPRLNRGWEFLLPTDLDFVKKHPDVAQRQQMLWLGIQAKLEKVFNFSKEDFGPKKQAVMDAVHISGDQRLKAAQDGAREKNSVLQRELDARRRPSGAPEAQVRVKQEPLSDSEEPMDTSAPPNGHMNGLPPSLLRFVSETFRKHSVLTLSELKRLFNLHLAGLPSGHAPYGHVNDRVLQEAVLKSHCKQILVPLCLRSTSRSMTSGALGGAAQRSDSFTDEERDCACGVGFSLVVNLLKLLVLEEMSKRSIRSSRTVAESIAGASKGSDESVSGASADEQKVFGLWESGETFDKHRQVLFEIFMKNYRVRRNLVQTRLTQELGDGVTKTDIDRLLKECCLTHYLSELWAEKGRGFCSSGSRRETFESVRERHLLTETPRGTLSVPPPESSVLSLSGFAHKRGVTRAGDLIVLVPRVDGRVQKRNSSFRRIFISEKLL